MDNSSNALLTKLRILIMLPPADKEHTQLLVRWIEAAKRRWDWQVDVVCPARDREAFKQAAAPGGQIFTRPNMLETAAWEAEPEAVADIDRRLQEAEFATGIPVGQILLAGELGIGRAFVASARMLPSSPVVSRVFKDNTEPSRIIRRLFSFADKLIADRLPDVIFTSELANPQYFTIWLAAAASGIPCVTPRRSKLNSDHCYWTMEQTLLNRAAEQAALAKHKAKMSVSDAAKAYIQAFRDRPKMVKYIQTKWSHGTKRGWLRWHLRFARTIAGELIKRPVPGYDPALHSFILGRLVAYNRRLIQSYTHRRFFRTFDEAELEGVKYIYFPLHKEPEIALRLQATAWHDQRNTVQVLASLLPSGYRLLVREHRLNYGSRPTEYYRRLSTLPNVVLVDAFDSQFKYLRHADLIVTENGTSGWEGLLLGRRVITLARTLYDGAGLAIRVRDPDQLGAEILKALQRPPVVDPEMHERHLGYMVDAERETTFPMGPEGTDACLDHLGRELVEALGSRIAAPRAAAR